ncbi:MAG: ABC-2 family transporter protein [Candidatus Poribacteria bacterium]|nr:ABC-2 family transporter protein [Candidatus Poribacteria bacterium]
MENLRKSWRHLRIYIRFSKIRFVDKLSYRAHFFLVLTEYLLIVIVSYFLWKAILTDGRVIRGYSLKDMVTYVAIAGVFRFFINEFSGAISREMGGQYRTGELIMNLLKPVSYQLYIYFHAFGGILFHSVFRIVPVLTLWALLVGLTAPDHLAIFLTSLVLGALVHAGIAFLVGLTIFYVEDNSGILHATSAIIELLSGTLIPLVMYPAWLVSTMNYLPFRFIFYQPMEIYLGHLGKEAGIAVLCAQTVWVFALSTAGYFLFKNSIQKITIQGG